MRVAAPRIAITGARGRLGRALVSAIGGDVIEWSRPDFDLDRPSTAEELIDRHRPQLVVHTAAMTDVDGCAREPDSAMRRNAGAVHALARAAATSGAGLVLMSTNEVFDGERHDGRGYREDDPAQPRNPYGASKLAGEQAARAAYGHAWAGLWIVRTAWLYGPPGGDFPDRIVAAADRLPAGEPLAVVEDEHGSPTLTTDLAAAIVTLFRSTDGGLFHLVNGGVASRLDWARRVLAVRRPDRGLRPIPGAEFVRDSDPPAWAVLDASKAASSVGIRLRDWREASDVELARRVGGGS